MKIGNQLRIWRVIARKSQTEIGQLFGVSHQAVSQWERGLATPKDWQIRTLQGFYKIRPSKCIIKEVR